MRFVLAALPCSRSPGGVMNRTPPQDPPRSPKDRATQARGDAFAKHTMSGPSRQGADVTAISARPTAEPASGVAGSDHGALLAEKVDVVESLAAAMPSNPLKASRVRQGGGHRAKGRRTDPGDFVALARAARLPKPCRPQRSERAVPPTRAQSEPCAARRGARRLARADAHDQPGRPGRRQPELAEGRPARADAARGLHPAREDHALRPRAHPGARRARARLGGARLLRVLRGR